ncbi:TPA: phage tail protein I [Pasteurella multocida]|uniref:phage tail protein I n=1 Tax=Pasteurella multocida TaxID=747 RepID=UPI00201FFBC2|nr:phage tail protein I [Pasteurella multocida]MCL7759366.1 phage tail protein I [Pasteurella multocida]MDY0506255.1 phage tail protein I [Pasteurella multocida]MEB3481073.1 phage tail protein I [Pasteurella multocida]HDR1048079.1 phage tail protein I [Pasteurella multocida]HDR1140481.1 phage tail protein I [Pasteurella multocida]
MTTNKTLLPTGSTTLEKRAAQIMKSAVENPVIIADLINPDRCPVHLLPYLAWAFSVDKWDENWSEEVKRIVIKQSFFIHKHKGTIGAVKRVVEPIGYLVELKEWFQTQPQGTAGTFSLTVEVSETGLNEQTYNELVRLVNDVKPVSRHLSQLAIAVSPTGAMHAFLAQNSGEIISVYP